MTRPIFKLTCCSCSLCHFPQIGSSTDFQHSIRITEYRATGNLKGGKACNKKISLSNTPRTQVSPILKIWSRLTYPEASRSHADIIHRSVFSQEPLIMKNFIRRACLLLVVSSISPLWSQEKVDLETMGRIRYEGFRDSKVMELASGLMDSIGERLTGSPNMKRANEWTRDQLTAMGLSNAHLEPWGPFGRGWANQYTNVRMTSPDVVTLLAYPKAWTSGTNGVVQGKCIRATIDDKKDFDKYKGKLAGMIVILGADAEVKPIAEAPYKRLTDDDLAKLADYQIPADHPPFNFATFVKRQQFIKDLNQFFADEKVLAVIDHSRGTSGGGTVFVQSGGSYKPGETTSIPQLTMASEHWTRIARLLQQKKDVTLELNVQNSFYDDDPMQYDTIAEIPGGDKKDEVVMLGAHLAYWHHAP